MPKVEDVVAKLRAKGIDEETIKMVATMATPQTEMDEGAAGVVKTKKGALMVRVSSDRWPIAMYAKDWRILLSKVPLIERALDTWDIPEVNPEPETTGSRRRAA